MPRAEPQASWFAAISIERAGYSPGTMLTEQGTRYPEDERNFVRRQLCRIVSEIFRPSSGWRLKL